MIRISKSLHMHVLKIAIMAAALTGPAFAGDLEPVVIQGPLTAPPAFSTYPRIHYIWTGAYVGLNAGLSFGHINWQSSAVLDVPAGRLSGSSSSTGGVIGATIGYNLQTNDPWVFGVEADLDASGVKATVSVPSCRTSCAVANPWFSTARIRVGYAFETILPYVTVGAAFGDLTATPATPGMFFARQFANNFGWTAGLGVEVAIWAPLRVQLEYLHIDLGSIQCPVDVTGVVPGCFGPKFNVSADIIRAGVNYRIWSN
jgi:outer membrane immunogenic protein